MMKSIIKNLILLTFFSIAMGFLESAVVVYLRGLLTTTNEIARLGPYVPVETLREAVTIVMLFTVGWLTAGRFIPGLAYSLFAFGIWDVFYYIWLRVLIGWPSSFFSRDVLFFIPVRWTGPVLAPMLISAILCTGSVLFLLRQEKGLPHGITWPRALVFCTGGLIDLYAFLEESLLTLAQGRQPDFTDLSHPFNWFIFLIGLALMAAPVLIPVAKYKRIGHDSHA
jgi:hypothetical protein